MGGVTESMAQRDGDEGWLIEAVGKPVEDSILGWPIRVSAFSHRVWTPTVEVSRWPDGENPYGDPDHTFDLTTEGAIELAFHLVAVANKVRELGGEPGAGRAELPLG